MKVRDLIKLLADRNMDDDVVLTLGGKVGIVSNVSASNQTGLVGLTAEKEVPIRRLLAVVGG